MRTVVMAKSGETIAIGGFITTEDEKTSTKVPWLGDIPLLGSLFRHSSTDRVDKELLIFITPRIVTITDKMEMWRNELAEEQEKATVVENKEMATKPSAAEGQEVVTGSDKSSKMVEEKLPFREQEELGNLNIDLTLSKSSLEVVDLVK